MSSVTVCDCLQNTPACLWAVNSRQSDQQQKKQMVIWVVSE